ncbi:hypothetical protein CKQ79_29845, partial [Klebsiella pneumoniae]
MEDPLLRVATARRPSPSAEMLRRTCSRRIVTDWRRVDHGWRTRCFASRPHADHHRPRRCCGEPAAAG